MGAMRGLLDPSTLVLCGLALALTIVACLKAPGLPMIGARNGVAMLWFILPRLVPALILAGLMRVLVPQEVVSHYFGREGGPRAPGLAFPVVAGRLVAVFYSE